jgi:hypothetical protein
VVKPRSGGEEIALPVRAGKLKTTKKRGLKDRHLIESNGIRHARQRNVNVDAFCRVNGR